MSLKEMAQEVLDMVGRGFYEVAGTRVTFRTEQEAAESGSRLYRPEQLAQVRTNANDGGLPAIRVVDGTAQIVAASLATDLGAGDHLAILNFASARNPGGGFLNGAKAQEEDLCRCSGLYPCLLRFPEYYEANRKQDCLLYTDHAIFSPRVPFFKTRGTGEYLPEPFSASVITAPAPNSGPFLRGDPSGVDRLEETFLRRWENVLAIAADQQVTHLLLGAWGCGAFGGDPEMAARTARIAVQQQSRGMTEIVFAIPGKGRQSRANLEAFRACFGGTIQPGSED